ASSTLTQRRARGSVLSFLCGVGLGFPPLLMFDFRAGWWADPDVFETCVLIAAAITFFLFAAVWDLRVQPDRQDPVLLTRAIVPVVPAPKSRDVPDSSPAPRRRGPVPIAIARQRASYAAYGKREILRRRSRISGC
ncbi:MAG: hypothetical protein AAGJ50_02860, partial [Pseudomonadota bacterium]